MSLSTRFINRMHELGYDINSIFFQERCIITLEYKLSFAQANGIDSVSGKFGGFFGDETENKPKNRFIKLKNQPAELLGYLEYVKEIYVMQIPDLKCNRISF